MAQVLTRQIKAATAPDVVLLEVFKRLSFKDLRSASRTCSNWRRIAQDWSLYKTLDFRDGTVRIAGMWRLCREHFAPCLKSVYLRGLLHKGNYKRAPFRKKNTPSKTLFRLMCEKCPNLTELGVTRLSLIGIPAYELPTTLEKLELVNTFTRAGFFVYLLEPEYKGHLSHLTHLDISGTTKFYDEDINQIAQLKCPLVSLKLNRLIKVTDKGIKIIANSMPNLRDLEMASVHGTDQGVEAITKKLKKLTNLSIAWLVLPTDKSFKHIAKRLKKLKSLNVTGCNRFSKQCLDVLPRFHRIGLLKLSYTPMANEEALGPVRLTNPSCEIESVFNPAEFKPRFVSQPMHT